MDVNSKNVTFTIYLIPLMSQVPDKTNGEVRPGWGTYDGKGWGALPQDRGGMFRVSQCWGRRGHTGATGPAYAKGSEKATGWDCSKDSEKAAGWDCSGWPRQESKE
jgi:hypothetical protein